VKFQFPEVSTGHVSWRAACHHKGGKECSGVSTTKWSQETVSSIPAAPVVPSRIYSWIERPERPAFIFEGLEYPFLSPKWTNATQVGAGQMKMG